jgi:hypothetical protein
MCFGELWDRSLLLSVVFDKVLAVLTSVTKDKQEALRSRPNKTSAVLYQRAAVLLSKYLILNSIVISRIV